ncbi:MAG TPA: PHP domain-containing protein [Dehalococcoidia bacterium]|nr:PHP domain-containing protein [Dehalococcoidia bacterium]
MIIDIHTHTRPYSDDSDLTPEELIQKAKCSGLDGVCFTEHDFFWKDEDISRLSNKHDFLIFPGVEINTEEGHLIVFGLKKYEFGMHRTKFVRKLVEEVGGAIILAHPYRGRVHQNPNPEQLLEQACKNSVFELVDAVEMLNGRSKAIENSFVQELCRGLDLRTVAGSDAHSLSDIPTCATLFERRIRNLQELISELKKGRFRTIDLRSSREENTQ